jgi:hypothetical protein
MRRRPRTLERTGGGRSAPPGRSAGHATPRRSSGLAGVRGVPSDRRAATSRLRRRTRATKEGRVCSTSWVGLPVQACTWPLSWAQADSHSSSDLCSATRRRSISNVCSYSFGRHAPGRSGPAVEDRESAPFVGHAPTRCSRSVPGGCDGASRAVGGADGHAKAFVGRRRGVGVMGVSLMHRGQSCAAPPLPRKSGPPDRSTSRLLLLHCESFGSWRSAPDFAAGQVAV